MRRACFCASDMPFLARWVVGILAERVTEFCIVIGLFGMTKQKLEGKWCAITECAISGRFIWEMVEKWVRSRELCAITRCVPEPGVP